MAPARLTPVAAIAAACAGASAWCSLGALALSDAGSRAVRVGLLPPFWWLGALVVLSVALAWALRLPPDRAKPLFFSAVLMLPWLPGRLPASLLLWAGPFVWFVWIATAAAVLSARGAPADRVARGRAALSQPARAPWLAFLCAAVIYNAAAWRLAPLVPGGDEPHYLVIAQSLWRDGDLRIENNHRRGDYLEYFGGELRPDYLARGADGQIYSIHLPGVSAILAPVLALGGYGLVKTFLALVSAAATSAAWRAAYLVTGSAAAAWFGWAGAALAAPVLLLSFTVYPDGPGAVVVMLAFGLAVSLHHRASRPLWWWVGAGGLPALLPWFHPRFSVLAAALGVMLAGRALKDGRPLRALGGFVALPAASAIGWFGYYHAIYGRFNPAVAYGHYTQMSAGRIPIGVLGLLFDQQYGLVVYAPVFAVAAAGLVALARRHPRIALEWMIIVVPYTVVTAMYHMWWGGLSSPARFAGATLLIFSVPLAAAWASTTHPVTRAIQAMALGVSAGISMMLVSVEGGAFVFNVRDVAAPWLAWASQMADLTRAVPSLFRHGPATALAEVLAWAGALLGAWLAARLAARVWGWKPGASALAAACAIGVAVMVAAAAAWTIEGAAGTRVTYGQLRALDAAATLRSALGVVPESRSFMPASLALERLRIAPEPAAGTPAADWLSLPYLPAGRYRFWVDLSMAGAFEMSLLGGDSDGPVESWRLAEGGTGASSRDFMLPVGLSGLRVRGDAGARPAIRSVWLQPVFGDGHPRAAANRRASSARRYGQVIVYALGGVYLEPEGLWTAGGRTADLVMQIVQGGRLAVFTMRAGPVPTPVEVRAGRFELRVELAPGEERELAIPVAATGAAAVTIHAGRSFRPSETDPSSSDRRLLGVRLEPQNRTTPPK